VVIAVARARATVDRIVVLLWEFHRAQSRTARTALEDSEAGEQAFRARLASAGNDHPLNAAEQLAVDDRLVGVKVDHLAEVDLPEVMRLASIT